MPHRGLDAAETEFIRGFREASAWEADCFAVAAFGEIVDCSTAGISQSHHLGDLVVSFTGGVVARAAEMDVSADAVDAVKQRVTAGSEQGEIGKGHLMLELNR